MKSLTATLPAMVLLLLAVACADGGTVNQRGKVAASTALPGVTPDNGDVSTDPKASDFSGPTLVEAKNTAAVSPEFKANVLLASKISAEQIMIFGKDGKSWLYNPTADAAPTQLEPPIVKLSGTSLLTLPDGKFWVVGDKTIGRRKAGDGTGGSVPVENFNTTTIKGDWAKTRVLYAAPDTLILQLDTSVAILAVRNGTPSLSQFSSTLPVALEGGIVAAGETVGGGYWFASKETVAVLEMSGLSLAWSRAKVPFTGHEDYGQIAMRIDSGKKVVDGDILLFQGDKYWSVTGAAIQ